MNRKLSILSGVVDVWHTWQSSWPLHHWNSTAYLQSIRQRILHFPEAVINRADNWEVFIVPVAASLRSVHWWITFRPGVSYFAETDMPLMSCDLLSQTLIPGGVIHIFGLFQRIRFSPILFLHSIWRRFAHRSNELLFVGLSIPDSEQRAMIQWRH